MGDDLFADARLYDYLLVLDRELSERARHWWCWRASARSAPRGLASLKPYWV